MGTWRYDVEYVDDSGNPVGGISTDHETYESAYERFTWIYSDNPRVAQIKSVTFRQERAQA